MLTYLLGGCIGNTDFYIYTRTNSSTHYTARQLLRAPSLVRKLRETLLFHPENFHDAGELKKLQTSALLAHLREFPEEAVAFADRCKKEGRQALVENVIGEALQNGADKDHLRKLFPWFPFRGETKDLSAEEYEQKFERDERAASEYDAYERVARPKRARRTFEDEEEEEMDRPVHCSHPLFSMFKGDGLHMYKRCPLENIQKTLALVRYIEKHPELVSTKESAISSFNPFQAIEEGGPASLPALVATVLATVESCPKESIPEEVKAFLVKHMNKADIASSKFLEPWSVFTDRLGEEVGAVLDQYLCSEKELDQFNRALPKNMDAEWLTAQQSNPVLVKTIVTWLEKEGPNFIRTREDFDRVKTQLNEEYARRMRGHPTVTQNYVTDNCNNQMRSILWMICQKNLPIEDAVIITDNFGLDGALDTIAENTLITQGKMEPDTGWKIWDKVKQEEEGPVGLSYFLMRRFALVRSSFAAQPGRACVCIENDVIVPLIQGLKESQNECQLLKTVDMLARFDPAEAQGIFQKLLQEKEFRDLLRSTLLQMSEHEEIVTPLARLCYSDLTYPRLPFRADYSGASEAGKIDLSPAMAWALDRESKDGVHWFPRSVPVLQDDAFVQRWFDIVGSCDYPPPPPAQPGSGEGSERGENRRGTQSMEDLRDSLIRNLDEEEEPESDQSEADQPELPSVSNLSEKPKQVGELSEALEGDARYLATKICDDFDTEWLAHLPLQKIQKMDLRPIFHQSVENGHDVQLHMRMGDGAVVPVSMGGVLQSVSPDAGRARWAGHWSKRIDADTPTNTTIHYSIAEDRKPSTKTLEEMLQHMPPSLRTNMKSLSNPSDLPPKFQEFLRTINVKMLPISDVVEQVTAFVHEHYEYCFLLQDPVYKERYRALLEGMPYRTDQNEYLAFIHSLRMEQERFLGRGICGQLTTVLEHALRSIGIPAYFTTGFCPSGTKITTNDAHAWVSVPFLDAKGTLFFKPVEATSGGIAGLDAANLEHLARVSEENEAMKQKTLPDPNASKIPETIQDDVDAIRMHLLSALGDSSLEISQSDIWMVDTLISEAKESKDAPSKTRDQIQSLFAESRNTLPAGVLDRWGQSNPSYRGHLFTPKIRRRMAVLAEEIQDDLTPAAKRIITHLIEDNQQAYDKWQSTLPLHPEPENW